MSHTPWVSSDAWGIFYLLKMSGSDKRFFVKKNNEQKASQWIKEKVCIHSFTKSKRAIKSKLRLSMAYRNITKEVTNVLSFFLIIKVTRNVMSVMTYTMIEK